MFQWVDKQRGDRSEGQRSRNEIGIPKILLDLDPRRAQTAESQTNDKLW
jgi:hypothetical protein